MNDIPEMTNEEYRRFLDNVKALLKAGWHTGKIRDWAVGAGSGFARFWPSPDEALRVINSICRAQNKVIAAQNRLIKRNITRRMLADPEVRELIRITGAKLRFRK